MGFKNSVIKIYNWPFLSKVETNTNQKKIRDTEWDAIATFIKKGNFLDVGCGAGYSMTKAQAMGCSVYGIDPDPGGHGVGREGSNFDVGSVNIKQAFAEKIPFETEMFDTVYSSHVLEHVNSEVESLKEMKRVLKNDGTLIIGMPTSHMAYINLITSTFFTTHQRLVNFFLSPFIKTGKITFRELFVPNSHSHQNKTVFFDIKKYKIKNWQKIVEQEFSIIETIKPAFYPYPEAIQWFKFRKNYRLTSSVFFVCKKK
jgi:ubiquinone/menaquinone biosynthesis C-methylase UbiE